MSSPQHEPTMEEILASIRKIISEDNPDAAPQAQAPRPQPAPAPAPPAAPAPAAAPEPEKLDMDVLELTQEVVEPPPPPPSAPPPAPEPPSLTVVEEKTDEIVFEPIGPREPEADSGIFSDQTRKAMENVFDNIADESEETAPRPARAYSDEGASVESVFERAVRESFEPVLEKYLADNSNLVVERMKPLIREWMDENFPTLLENAVKSEVERIVRARTRR